MSKHIAIVGSGPAGLMAASVLADHGFSVSIFEKRKGPAHKLLIAGRSGLNISHESIDDKIFSTKQWLAFIHSLGIKTFKGTSHRYFIEGLKSPPLLKSWINKLKDQSVQFFYGQELTDFESYDSYVHLQFNHEEMKKFDSACFCLGGASYEPKETPLRWPDIFKRKNISFKDFEPSNVGYSIDWKDEFLNEAEGLPLKNITVQSSQGNMPGEIVITHYGLEGTPIYSIKNPETIFLDLKPDLDLKQILSKLDQIKENLSPIRRIKKYLNLNKAAVALLFHMSNLSEKNSINEWSKIIKKFPIELKEKQNLQDAISSKGGVCFNELSDDFMLKKFPGIYLAGEMIDWDAPTGGFLIHTCVSQGYKVANCLKYLIN